MPKQSGQRLTNRKIHDASEIEPKTPESASLVVSGKLLCDMAVANMFVVDVGFSASDDK